MKDVGHFRRSHTVLVMAVVAAFAVLLISELSYRRSSQALEMVGRLAQARLDLQGLQRSLVEAENSERVYLLAGRPEDLERYRASVQASNAAMEKLRSASLDGHDETPSIDLLDHLVSDKLASLRGLSYR